MTTAKKLGTLTRAELLDHRMKSEELVQFCLSHRKRKREEESEGDTIADVVLAHCPSPKRIRWSEPRNLCLLVIH